MSTSSVVKIPKKLLTYIYILSSICYCCIILNTIKKRYPIADSASIVGRQITLILKKRAII